MAAYDVQMMAGVGLLGVGSILLAVQVTLATPLAVSLQNGRVTLNEQGILFVGIVALVT